MVLAFEACQYSSEVLLRGWRDTSTLEPCSKTICVLSPLKVQSCLRSVLLCFRAASTQSLRMSAKLYTRDTVPFGQLQIEVHNLSGVGTRLVKMVMGLEALGYRLFHVEVGTGGPRMAWRSPSSTGGSSEP